MGDWWCCRASYPYHEKNCKHFVENPLMYEDELPEDMTDSEYSEWYEQSYVLDGVRVGPQRKKQETGYDIEMNDGQNFVDCP
jgi:hypothetical protein